MYYKRPTCSSLADSYLRPVTLPLTFARLQNLRHLPQTSSPERHLLNSCRRSTMLSPARRPLRDFNTDIDIRTLSGCLFFSLFTYLFLYLFIYSYIYFSQFKLLFRSRCFDCSQFYCCQFDCCLTIYVILSCHFHRHSDHVATSFTIGGAHPIPIERGPHQIRPHNF
jgi:hypothetical protein